MSSSGLCVPSKERTVFISSVLCPSLPPGNSTVVLTVYGVSLKFGFPWRIIFAVGEFIKGELLRVLFSTTILSLGSLANLDADNVGEIGGLLSNFFGSSPSKKSLGGLPAPFGFQSPGSP